MKSSSRDNAEGKIHQVKVNIQDDVWKTVKNRDLETEDKNENLDGKVHEKLGQVEIDVSSIHVNALIARPVAGPLMLIDLK